MSKDQVKLTKVQDGHSLIIRVVEQEKKDGGWKQGRSSNFTVHPEERVGPEKVREKLESFLERFEK